MQNLGNLGKILPVSNVNSANLSASRISLLLDSISRHNEGF